jgi:hypothetical protein
MRLPLKQLAQDGATQGQVVTWNNTTGKYEPGDSNLAGGISVSNRDMVASVTTADGQLATATTLASTIGAWVEVQVNGVGVEIGDGVKTKGCYLSGDSGTTARAYGALAAGDELYWNGSIAGYQLSATDRIDIIFDNEGAGGSGGGAVPLTSLEQGGATDSQVLTWDAGTSQWTPAVVALPPPGENSLMMCVDGGVSWTARPANMGFTPSDGLIPIPCAVGVGFAHEICTVACETAAVLMECTPSIQDSGPGHELTVAVHVDSTYSLTLQSEDTLTGSAVVLVGGGTVVLTPGSIIKFVFTQGVWQELYRYLV